MLTSSRSLIAEVRDSQNQQQHERWVPGTLTLAAVDRLVHHSTILEMNVESYRRRAAQAGHAPPARKRLVQQRNQFDSFSASTGQDS